MIAGAQLSPTYVPEARSWLVALTPDQIGATVADSDERLRPGIEAGLLALYQKCPHLGCRVPFCESSGWFECPCHGSKYTRLGEHREGPGPRGLDAFPVIVADGVVSIDTTVPVFGHPIGTVLVDLPAEGPACVGGGGD